MSRFVPAMKVAEHILHLAKAEAPPRDLTPLQLNKLTYIAHGWAYPCLGRRLIHDAVEAWQYGPVYPELYHALKHYSRDPVQFVPESSYEQIQKNLGKKIYLEEDEKKLIEAVYEGYKHASGSQLITLTHQKGTPWDKADFRSCEISEDEIRIHYENKVKS